LKNVFDILKERGFVEQTTGDEAVSGLLKEPVACYIGFDPTASSFHVGSLVPIMALAHIQRHGHRPIALVGGGTALVGDPSGKTEMRQMLTSRRVNENAEGLKNQLARFVDFEEGRAALVNNAEWLKKVKYISFLRDYGRHFSVNRMLTSESCRLRLETESGLSFIEFNYVLLQAYDFLHLYRTEKCVLQMGGSDQWGNIVAGIELIRRAERGTSYGITFPLITTSSGEKMGKTAKGAVWLDAALTSPYEYYQFWVNTEDPDVARFLSFFTFLPLHEIRRLEEIEGVDLNVAKTILAFEATRLVHGENEAVKAYQESTALFGARTVPPELLPSSVIHAVRQAEALRGEGAGGEDSLPDGGRSASPCSEFEPALLRKGIPAFKLFHQVGLAGSSGAARRLIQQGGGYLNNRRLEAFDEVVNDNDLKEGEILLRAGKKRYHRIVVSRAGTHEKKKGEKDN
jgi:tyrosyl-tRNA synthetase